MESVNNESGRSYRMTWAHPAREQGEEEDLTRLITTFYLNKWNLLASAVWQLSG